MEKYKLHYASIVNDGDIHCLEFNYLYELTEQVTCFVSKTTDVVWILSVGDEVFILDDYKVIIGVLDSINHGFLNRIMSNEFFLQEYGSYEEAYKVALAMKEPNPLCYE